MNLYQWKRAQEQRPPKPSRRDPLPPLPTTTATLRWKGVPTKLLIEPIQVEGSWYFSFRPLGAPEAQAFVAARQSDAWEDGFNWERGNVLFPYSIYDSRREEYLPQVTASIEAGLYGRFELEEIDGNADQTKNGSLTTFYSSSGQVLRRFYGQRVRTGSYGFLDFALLKNPNFDPALEAPPWCEAERAPALLNELRGERFADWVEREASDETTMAGFARAWKGWSHAERRAQLPAAERDIEDELERVLKWAYWSEPHFINGAPFPADARYPQLWYRPRFVTRPQSDQGYYLFHEDYYDEPSVAQLMRARARLRALWPHIEAAFAETVAQLPAPDELHPNLRHWCHHRGAYAVAFSAPTAHELLESHVALRDWLRARAGVELSGIEGELEAK